MKTEQLIASWIEAEAKKGNMCTKTSEQILAELENGQGLITVVDGQPIAYAKKLSWPNAGTEIGSVVVTPQNRKTGVGTEIINNAINQSAEGQIFALCENEISLAVFVKLGGRVTTKDNLHPEVWELCAPADVCIHRSKFPNCPCTPVILTHLKK